MDYPLENLGPDRFQELCQSLLARSLPDLQCFPLFQGDGGRDALSLVDGNLQKRAVFQVKFVRDPERHRAQPQIRRLIEQERPKIERLAKRGVERYYLLTNIRGTGTLDTGSIDRTSDLLERLPIPAQCWWRDDICRRLDDAWNIKLCHPDILTSVDIIRLFTQSAFSEGHERRENALRAFLQEHFEHDKDLRFKQIELKNEMLELFIDVPINLFPFIAGGPRAPQDGTIRALAEIAALQQDVEGQGELLDFDMLPLSVSVGAASLLLHPLAQRDIPQIVIEGAPGQGKSTIAQYVCQVHRHRLLNIPDKRICAEHQQSPIRLPFRVDCRDLSMWLSGKSPFSLTDEIAKDKFPHRTVESFLAAHIFADSGGASFDVDDLLATVSKIPTIILYDGLDEVADIALRREVVDAISKGTNRLRRNVPFLQTVVTSRPAVFANSPGLPKRLFPHLQLGPIGRSAAMDYANRWLGAQNLPRRESTDVREVLESKLRQEHIGELARNPMQLSILLSLILSHGSSLPDMRTRLYDSYVERAFNREAEKSAIVRRHRALFVDIHCYVAWILHSEAERGDNRGRIDEARLKRVVQRYLIGEGHAGIDVEQLFAGMVERIVALVSRIEGTYEFEVQPLREYFAAKHLYMTAPYTPQGVSQGGTKPDRFDAMARNFFWHNVTRFYAGFYDRGELASLVESLRALVVEDGYRDTSYPQTLAATLLADWVFAQYPRVMKQVVPIVVDGIGDRYTVAGGYEFRDVLRLPSECGSMELVDRCLDILAAGPPVDFGQVVADIVGSNSSIDSRVEQWRRRCSDMTPSQLTSWLEQGLRLGVVSELSDVEIEDYVGNDTDARLWTILRSEKRSIVERDDARMKRALDLTLRDPSRYAAGRAAGVMGAFSSALQPQRYLLAFVRGEAVPLEELWLRYRFWAFPDLGCSSDSEVAQKCAQFVSTAIDLGRKYSCFEWSTKLDPWKELVDKGRRVFGERWAWIAIANAAAGIRAIDVRGAQSASLFDVGVDLCGRVRYARLQGRSWRWWGRQLDESNDQLASTFALLVLFSWAGKSVLTRLAVVVDRELCTLDADAWERLWRTLSETDRYDGRARWLSLDLDELPRCLSTRFVVAIARRVRPADRFALYEKYVASYQGDDVGALEFCQRIAFYALRARPEEWKRWLEVVAYTYSQGVVIEEFFHYGFRRARDVDSVPQELAEEIVNGRKRYPVDLADMASDLVRTKVASKIRPLGRIAEEDGWFSEPSGG